MGTASATAPVAPIHKSMMVKNKLEVSHSLRLERLQELKEHGEKARLEAEKVIEAARQKEIQAQQELQAANEAAQQEVAPVAPVVASTTVVSGCGDNFYANYIYMHESSCNTSAVNSLGCRGIGQACPGDKLPCGADYACQNAYFTNYAIGRYGSWEAAYAFWLNNHWW